LMLQNPIHINIWIITTLMHVQIEELSNITAVKYCWLPLITLEPKSGH